MARTDMPPMVVSGNRFNDIQPYGDRIRASDPVKWVSVFPWEFPQGGEREEEEAFLRKFFTDEEIHVQGGAGDENRDGMGFKFLKQVWYAQALWNYEHRLPLFNDWWWKNAEAAGLVHDPTMQKYFLDPHVQLSTFFTSKDLELYGEKFLSQAIPMIQQTARTKIEEKEATAKKASSNKITRTVARVPESISVSEPPTAALDGKSNMPDLAKTTSQPQNAKPKMVSLIEFQPAAPHAAVPENTRPRMVSNEPQFPMEQPPFHCKRGMSGSGRHPNSAGGHFQPRQPSYHHHEQQLPPSMQMPVFRSASGPQFEPNLRSASGSQYEPYPSFGPGGPQEFVPRGRGQPAFPEGAPYPGFRFPTIDANRRPSSFATPFDGEQPNIIWAPNPLHDRTNQPGPHFGYDAPQDGGAGPRGGYGQGYHGKRGRGFSGDQGRGRGRGGGRGGRNSFGAHGQVPPSGWTSHEFKGPGPGAKARRNSDFSDEKNWRSGSERPQMDMQASGNFTPAVPNPLNAPQFQNNPFHGPPQHPGGPPPGRPGPPPGYHVLSENLPPPHDPRYHCTRDSIGDLCQYVTKLTLFIPTEVTDETARQIFERFGRVLSLSRFNPPMLNTKPTNTQLAFVNYATPDEARNCFNNRPITWPLTNSEFRVEIPKEYWDPTHHKFLAHQGSAANRGLPLQRPSMYGPAQGFGAMHQSHDSTSTIRAPVAQSPASPEPQNVPDETTPTASGANTPKKKSKSANKKGKNKQNKDQRAASLAGVEGEPTGKKPTPEASSAAHDTEGEKVQEVAAKKTVATEKPDLTINVEKQRSASESTEVQTTSEPSMTPVEKVTAKLPKPESAALKDAKDITASDVEDTPTVGTTASISVDRPIATSGSTSTSQPADVAAVDQSFREHKATKKAASAGDNVEGQRVKSSGSEEEVVDESFHTATGSPGSSKTLGDRDTAPDVSIGLKQSAFDNEPIDAAGAVPTVQVAEPAENEEEMEDHGNDKSSEVPVLTIDTASPTDELKPESIRSTSGSSALTPAAFVTAPNTPAIVQSTDDVTSTDGSATSQTEKTQKQEKAKGPSHTESLSMFGKKEKKPKKKKDTLRGKPKELEAASQAPSESKPEPKPVSKPARTKPAGQENRVKSTSQNTGKLKKENWSGGSQAGSNNNKKGSVSLENAGDADTTVLQEKENGSSSTAEKIKKDVKEGKEGKGGKDGNGGIFSGIKSFVMGGGGYIPDGGLEKLKKHDAILFGAVGAPDVPDHISLWGLRLAICQPLQQYANVRPTRILAGTESPLRKAKTGDLDWVIVRENSEGEYAGQGGRSHRGFPWETATEVSIFTRHAVERIIRFAFETAQKRPKKHLTVVSKSNAQRNGMVMWDEIANGMAKEFPDVKMDKMLVDAMTCRMVLQPQSLDTIVASNLHADILSDLAAALAGSIGIAPTSNLDPTREHPSMFEPIHGSAFDITGKGVANPVGTFWTAAEMVRWLGHEAAADYLMECVEAVCASGVLTRDLGGTAGTKEVTHAVCKEIEASSGKSKTLGRA